MSCLLKNKKSLSKTSSYYFLFGSLVIPLAVNILCSFSEVVETIFSDITSLIVPIALLSLLVFFLFYLANTDYLSFLSNKKYLAILLVSAFCISAISILSLDCELSGDYQYYHIIASRISQGLELGRPFKNLTIFKDRTYFFLVPLYYCFGARQIVAEWGNAVIFLLTGLNIFFIAKRSFYNTSVARLAILFFFIIPISYFYMNLVNHDIPGLFYTSLFCVLFTILFQKIKNSAKFLTCLIFSILLGLVLFIVDKQRNTGIFLSLSLVSFTFILSIIHYFTKPLGKYLRFMFVAIMLLCVIPLSIHISLRHHFSKDFRLNAIPTIRVFSCTDPSSSGRWKEYCDYYFSYANQTVYFVGGNIWSYSIGKLGSELYYNYSEFLSMLARKSNTLYNIGRQQNIFVRNSKKNILSTRVRNNFMILSTLIRILLFIFTIYSLFSFFSSYSLDNPFTIVILQWFFTGNLLLLNEVQSRYSYPFQINLCILAAFGFVKLFSANKADTFEDVSFDFRIISVIRKSILFVGATIAVLVLFPLFFRPLWSKCDYHLLDLSSPAIAFSTDNYISHKDITLNLKKTDRNMKYGLRLPPTDITSLTCEASWEKQVDRNRYYILKGFIRTNAFRNNNITVTLAINNLVVFSKQIGDIKGFRMFSDKSSNVKYIQTAPIYMNSDKLDLKLVLSADRPITKKLSELSKTYLEYVQIRKVNP